MLDSYQKTPDITDITGKAGRVMRDGACSSLTVSPSWTIIFDYGERASRGKSDIRVTIEDKGVSPSSRPRRGATGQGINPNACS